MGKAEAGLTYRGYAIEDLAAECEFEEVTHLLIRGTLPTLDELNAYKVLPTRPARAPHVTRELRFWHAVDHRMFRHRGRR